MKKNILIPLILFAIAATVYFSQSSEQPVEEYLAEIEEVRKEKHEYMTTSAESPFINDTLPFKGLKYFPPNPKFKVRARIEKLEKRSYLSLATSTGQNEKYLKYAYAHFTIDDQPLRLLLLKKANTGKKEPIFTAFADNTSGASTYGAGRYLDLDFKNASSIEIDFNLAYNPYCAYNESFTCPFPPAENILPIAIEAGEKNYHEY